MNMGKPEIDVLGKVMEKRRAMKRSFGPSEETKRLRELESGISEALSTIDCEYKTLLLRLKANHSEKITTASQLQFQMVKLCEMLKETEDLKEKGVGLH
jgi:hypothetical protein